MPDDQEVLAQHDLAALASAAVYAHPTPGEPMTGLPLFAVDRVFTDDQCGSGFYAAGFVHGKALVLAFCGSDEPLDLASGANLATCQYEPNRARLLAYARDKRWRSVLITGHSLAAVWPSIWPTTWRATGPRAAGSSCSSPSTGSAAFTD